MRNVQLKDGSFLQTDGVSATCTFGDKRIALDGGLVHGVNTGLIDADGAVFMQRQLEFIKARSYDVKYAELQARRIFPVENDAHEAATQITWRTYDQAGMAKIVNAYANDLPRSDVAGKENHAPVRTLADSFGYNVHEISASQMTGMGLEQRRANASRRAHEQTINKTAFYGDAEHGLGGFFDHPNIPVGPVVDPGSGTEWVNKTPEQILFDCNDLTASIFELTAMVERPNRLCIPPNQWTYITSTARSANSDTTIANYLAQNNPFLTSVADIVALNECSSVFNPLFADDVMFAYDASPEKLALQIPMEVKFEPVQPKNLEFVVPTWSRLGGLIVYYPLSAAIATGI